jgi:hypothetical protein
MMMSARLTCCWHRTRGCRWEMARASSDGGADEVRMVDDARCLNQAAHHLASGRHDNAHPRVVGLGTLCLLPTAAGAGGRAATVQTQTEVLGADRRVEGTTGTCHRSVDAKIRYPRPRRPAWSSPAPNGCLNEAPWLGNGGHGASIGQPFGSLSWMVDACGVVKTDVSTACGRQDRIIAREGCFHMASKKCIDNLISEWPRSHGVLTCGPDDENHTSIVAETRNRKCPICANPFDAKDVHVVRIQHIMMSSQIHDDELLPRGCTYAMCLRHAIWAQPHLAPGGGGSAIALCRAPTD